MGAGCPGFSFVPTRSCSERIRCSYSVKLLTCARGSPGKALQFSPGITAHSPGQLGRVYIFEGSTGTFVECPVNITALFGPDYGTCEMVRTSLGLRLQWKEKRKNKNQDAKDTVAEQAWEGWPWYYFTFRCWVPAPGARVFFLNPLLFICLPAQKSLKLGNLWSRTALCGSEAIYYMYLFKLINTYSLSHQFFDPTGHVSAAQWPHLTSGYTAQMESVPIPEQVHSAGLLPTDSAYKAVCTPRGQWFCLKRMPIHMLLPVPWRFQPKMFLSMEAARLPALTRQSKMVSDSSSLSKQHLRLKCLLLYYFSLILNVTPRMKRYLQHKQILISTVRATRTTDKETH